MRIDPWVGRFQALHFYFYPVVSPPGVALFLYRRVVERTNQMEERSNSAGSYWSGSVRDITVHPGPEGREIAEKTGTGGTSKVSRSIQSVQCVRRA